ncbi:MAG: hypothetical protein JRI55_40900 [Deltaproteobacteria bacterium]|jgi:hypothetical protein|nr:hypothetical protein [Deltaproteobacteria bacterium]
MPYRSGEPGCAVCQKLAVVRCYRCGRPLCARHAHPPERRCRFCEVWFAENRAPGRGSRYPFEIPSRAARWILLFTPLWPFGGGAIIKETQRSRRRREFLAEQLPRPVSGW